MIFKWVLSAVVLCAAGCTAATEGSVSGSTASGKDKPVPSINTAYMAFRQYAARKRGVSPHELDGTDRIDSTPQVEAHFRMLPNTTGAAWAFVARRSSDDGTGEIRGWATNDGTVITLDQNLGVLFAEAGVWGAGVSPPLTERQLAERLAWSMGMNHSVSIEPSLGVPAPQLTLKDGAGTFTFVVNYRQPGPGGAGGGPRQLTRIDVALSADHRATATRTRIASP